MSQSAYNPSDKVSPGPEQCFVAANMTQAMRMLTDELGAEAILLSSRRVANGVEVIGLPPGASPSVDDFSALHSDRRKGDRRSQGRRASDRIDVPEDQQATQQPLPASSEIPVPEADEKLHSARIDLRQTAADLARQIEALGRRGESVAPSAAPENNSPSPQLVASSNIGAVDTQLEPAEYIVSSRLRQLQLSDNLVRQLLASSLRNQGESPPTVEALWGCCIDQLRALLPATAPVLAEAGGVYAFVGPAAVGKSSVIHKLLARFALEGRADELALVTFASDDQSPAQRRLERLARVSGIECHSVSDAAGLQGALEESVTRRTVLIDASRGEGVGGSYTAAVAELRHADVIREVICLSATSDGRYQRDMLSRYRSPRTASCLFTHCDETQAMGSILSLLVEQQLPLLALGSGALLPDELLSPDAEQLVESLVEGSELALAGMSREVMTPIVNLSRDERAASPPG